jgi:hypothetical protein
LKGTDIHKLLVTAWGDVIGVRQIQRLMKEFEDGKRTSFARKEGSGRPKSEKRIDLVEKVKADLMVEPRCGSRYLAAKYETTKDMILEIIRDDLGYRCVQSVWVPYALTEMNKEQRVACCEVIVSMLDKRNMNKNLIVIDEKQFYSRGMGNPVSRMAWIPPDGDAPRIARRLPMAKKWMVLYAANFDGLHFFKVMPTGVTVTAAVYIDFLQEAVASFNTHQLTVARKAVRWENAVIMHDNAPVHVAKTTTNFLESKHCRIVKQPAYSPDTNLCDRMIFPLLEMRRRSVIFDSAESIEQFLRDATATLTSEVMITEFYKLQQHCLEIIDHNGDYVQ